MNKEALSNLGQFYGTEQYHRFSVLFPNLLLTDGVNYVCENAGAYWFMDIIGSFQKLAQKDESLKQMQFWTLRPYPQRNEHVVGTIGHMLNTLGKIPAPTPEIKTQGGILEHLKPQESGTPQAYVTCDRDSDDTAIVQDILMTDFPFDTMSEFRVYVQPDGRGHYIVMLPSEY